MVSSPSFLCYVSTQSRPGLLPPPNYRRSHRGPPPPPHSSGLRVRQQLVTAPPPPQWLLPHTLVSWPGARCVPGEGGGAITALQVDGAHHVTRSYGGASCRHILIHPSHGTHTISRPCVFLTFYFHGWPNERARRTTFKIVPHQTAMYYITMCLGGPQTCACLLDEFGVSLN